MAHEHNGKAGGPYDRLQVHAGQRLLMGVLPADGDARSAPRQLPAPGRRFLLPGTSQAYIRGEVRSAAIIAQEKCLGPEATVDLIVTAFDQALARVGVERAA